MVDDAEKYAEADKAVRETVEKKNEMENMCYSLKQSISDEKIKDKIEEADRTAIEEACKAKLQWLESNQAASADEYAEQTKELQDISNPIMTKLYAAAGGEGGMPGGMPDFSNMGGTGGPTPGAG